LPSVIYWPCPQTLDYDKAALGSREHSYITAGISLYNIDPGCMSNTTLDVASIIIAVKLKISFL
jgi:hypothetical protein